MTYPVTRFDRVATVQARIGWKALTADEYVEDGYVFLATPNIKSDEIDFQNVNFINRFRYDESPELKLRPDDVLLVKDGNTLGITNLVRSLPRPATVNGSIAVIRTESMHASYLRYVLASDLIQGRIQAYRAGMGVPHLFQADIRKFPLPEPPFLTQRAIADYLDVETARIDGLVESKRRLAVLVERARASQADAAVLGQDRPDLVPQSKIPWLGSLPASWTVRALRHLASGKDGLFTDGDWVELPHITTEGNRLIQTGNIGIGRYREQGFRYVSDASFSELGCTEVRPGDVLICRLAEPVGRACLAPDLGVRMITSVDVCILRPGKDVFAPYLVEYLSSGAYLAYMDAIARGGTRDRVSRDQLGAVPVPLPSLAEQHEVAERLADLRRRSDDLAGLLDRQIQFLEERRHALITAAVTGQFEIPGVAA